MEKIFCGNCGYPNPSGNNFCNNCGNKLNFIQTEKEIFDHKETINVNDNGSSSYDDFAKKLSKLIFTYGYLNLICEDRYLQFLKYKKVNKLYIALINIEDFDSEKLEKAKFLQFTPVDENLIKCFNYVSDDKFIIDVIEFTKSAFENIYMVDVSKPLIIEDFIGIDLEENTSELIKSQEKKTESNYKVWLFVVGVLCLIVFYFYTTNSSSRTNLASSAAPTNSSVSINTPLQTGYFEVTVNKVTLSDYVNTGNEYTDLKNESGERYVIIYITFKNTDTESRNTFSDGSIHINYNGTDYDFDKSETIMLDGWGMLLEQINPLESKTTKLVFKIPSEVKGEAYYNPTRAESDKLIDLGNIQ